MRISNLHTRVRECEVSSMGRNVRVTRGTFQRLIRLVGLADQAAGEAPGIAGPWRVNSKTMSPTNRRNDSFSTNCL